MSTRSKTISIRRNPAKYLVVCLNNDGYEASLESRKFYVEIRDADAESHDQLRVVDESGDDYLFPASYFAAPKLPITLRRRLLLLRPSNRRYQAA